VAASLGSLILELACDSARFQGDLGRAAAIAESKMRNIKDTAERALGAVTVIAAAAGAALTASLVSALNRADDLNKLSQAAGIAADSLSKLQFAAAQSGVETDGLAAGLKKFNVEINNASSGNVEALAAFRAVGVSVKDTNGHVKDAATLLSEVSSGFAGASDGASKSALAVALFGKQGTDLIPLLNQGSEGLKKLGEQAQRAGLVIGKEAAQAAEDFNDKLTVLKRTVTEGLGNQLITAILPALTRLAETFTASATSARGLSETAEQLVTGLKIVASGAIATATAFQIAGKYVAFYASALESVSHFDFKEVGEVRKRFTDDILQTAEQFKTRWAAIWSEVAAIPAEKTKGSGSPAQIVYDPNAVRAAQQRAKDSAKWNKDLLKDLATAQQELSKDLMENAKDTFEPYQAIANEAMEKQRQALDSGKSKYKASTDEMTEYARRAARNIQDVMADFLFDPFSKGLDGMLSGFLDVVRRMAAEAAAANLAGYLFGSQQSDGSRTAGVLASALGGLFGGTRAAGGPVSAGSAYLVGESGPEVLQMGSQGGSIVPNGALGGGGGQPVSISYNIDARGATTELIKVLPSILRQHGEQLEGHIVAGLKNGRYGARLN
jgi:uncharacterized protein YukE